MGLHDLRSRLLTEAKSSPLLLSDLAGLEKYIGESYTNRSFIELLQNADDALASKFKIFEDNGFLFVCNDGRCFTDLDLEGLCRSAASKKIRGESIGYRGIGFKSVVGFAEEIHLFSGDLNLTFSRKRTALEIPEAKEVPLIRIPHPTLPTLHESLEEIISRLNDEGFNTVFVFSGLAAQEIRNEFETIDSSIILFLRNIISINIKLFNEKSVGLSKKTLSESLIRAELITESESEIWIKYSHNGLSFAFSANSGLVHTLSNNKAVVHSFLPTEDFCGFGMLINGDFNTDPSRKHIILNQGSLDEIRKAARIIVHLFKKAVFEDEELYPGILEALTPINDPSLLQFKGRSFENLLLGEIKAVGKDFFSSISLCPKWLNQKDYQSISSSSTANLDSALFPENNLIQYLKYLGAKESSLDFIIETINDSQVSVLGCSQVAVRIIQKIISGRYQPNSWAFKTQVFLVENKRLSLDEIQQADGKVDKDFLFLLLDNGASEFEVKQVLKGFLVEEAFTRSKQDIDKNTELFSEGVDTSDRWFGNKKISPHDNPKSSAKRWRTAEENTLLVLNENGFRLKDVSKQNLGYDLEGSSPDGDEIQIEVKSIAHPGQKFRLTNNEVAVAQENGSSYFLAVVLVTDGYLEVELISSPIEKLKLDRQCVQWVWECSNYTFTPYRFEI